MPNKVLKIHPQNLLFFALIVLASVQNSFFDSIFRVSIFGGMDGLSVLLFLMLATVFALRFLAGKIHCTVRLICAVVIFCIACIAGLLNYSSVKDFAWSMRIYLYLFLGYFIGKSLVISKRTLSKGVCLAGILSGGLYMFFYLLNSQSSTAGFTFRNVSFNLYWCLLAIAFTLLLSSYVPGLLKILVILICPLTVIISQQRTLIIPLGLIIVWFVFRNLKVNIKSIILLAFFLLVCVVGYIWLSELDNFLEVLLRRFTFDYFFGKNSTLGIRIDTMRDAFSQLNPAELFFGSGFGAIEELETWVPNYLVRFGFLGTIALFLIYYDGYAALYWAGRFNKRSFYRTLFWICISLSVGGFISGYSYEHGQLMIGLLSGLAYRMAVPLCVPDYQIKRQQIQKTNQEIPLSCK